MTTASTTAGGFRYPRSSSPPTWECFKARIREVDRDSLLIQAAAATATVAHRRAPDHWARRGLTPWTIADVARTALAWGSFTRPEADADILLRLCNMNVHLADESLDSHDSSSERVGSLLTRIIFEQVPAQRSVMAGAARSILLFGSIAEHPTTFSPEAMTPGWFETVTNGLTLDEYVESVVLVSTLAGQYEGGFSLDWLDTPAFHGLENVFSFDAVRRAFSEHLVTTIDDFKSDNRKAQEAVSTAQKKYAFNPLAAKPFVEGVAPIPIAPCVQMIISKILPPAIYHLAWPVLGDAFTHDLGAIFQHYSGRQLSLIDGERQVLPEVAYGPRRNRLDSCDWFLDLPGLLVLIECKARQPNESLRIYGAAWLGSVQESIGKGIRQLNRSHKNTAKISAACPQIDPAKRRVGLVVTLESFFINQNWFMWEHLEQADFPVGVVSIDELESLVLLSADELAAVLIGAADAAQQTDAMSENLMLLNPVLEAAEGRENPLLAATWESIGLFERIERTAERLRATAETDVG